MENLNKYNKMSDTDKIALIDSAETAEDIQKLKVLVDQDPDKSFQGILSSKHRELYKDKDFQNEIEELYRKEINIRENIENTINSNEELEREDIQVLITEIKRNLAKLEEKLVEKQQSTTRTH